MQTPYEAARSLIRRLETCETEQESESLLKALAVLVAAHPELQSRGLLDVDS